ncbi:hypothetical protein GGQ73_001821 [Rhizobium skierniewicense]|uniref:Uncharacterized protein n=1 Tax=Rhizobium skierniewicense TaxID=984260 RepID=A0A7W6CES9_9HYPH|nr:hypothetical protein [Rhizobium skierniewicense]MBB3945886.1 hypothetical protein [Rhizobium skierniewicense]
MAFVIYSGRLRSKLVRYDNDGDPQVEDVRLYRGRLIQASKTFDLTPLIIDTINGGGTLSSFAEAREYLSSIDGLFDFKMLADSRSRTSAVFDTVVIRDDYKDSIRNLVNKIKVRIDSADLGTQKQESLFIKLNLFLKELDNERTKLTALMAAFVQVSGSVGEAAEKLGPAVDLFERVMKAVGLGSREMRGLPKSDEEQKLLPPPENLEE